MISQESEFELINRGFKDTIVLIPGWATDYRVFSNLKLDYNYILAVKPDPFAFSKSLLRLLNEKSLSKVSLFGWSLGGFLAADFSLKYSDRIEELILVSIRKRFDVKALEDVRQKILENRPAYLYKFYLECFSGNDKKGFLWFKKNLLKDYLKEIELRDLEAGLDYLSRASISSKSFVSLKKVRIFHSPLDKICPFEEAQAIGKGLRQVKFIPMPQAGHALFLDSDFKEAV